MVLWDWSRGNEITDYVETEDANGNCCIRYQFANGQHASVFVLQTYMNDSES